MKANLQLLSVHPGPINTQSIKKPTLIKQDNQYFVYGHSRGIAWELTPLNHPEFLNDIENTRLSFPSQKDKPETLVYHPRYEKIYQHIASLGAKVLTIHHDMLKAQSDYEQVMHCYFREQAAKHIQLSFRIKQRFNHLKAESNPKTQKLLLENIQKLKQQRHNNQRTIHEPMGLQAEGFIQQLAKTIEIGRYDLIEYAHPDFTRLLFKALRQGIIDMSQMMTAKLMFDSILCFNLGKLPDTTHCCFSRFMLDDPNGPYQPSSMSYWGEEQTQQLHLLLNKPNAQLKNHYYTINLLYHQSVLFFYLSLKGLARKKELLKNAPHGFFKLLESYVNFKADLNEEDIRTLMTHIVVRNKITQQEVWQIMRWLRKVEPHYSSWHHNGTHHVIGLSEHTWHYEEQSIRFLANLYEIDCQIPILCRSPEFNANNPKTPIMSFILPTIDALNTLQSIVHGPETCHPIPVVGQETLRMIRAFDEIPALLNHNKRLSPVAQGLVYLYPMTEKLTKPSRPIELTHPDILKTNQPHGADCYDFLLSWHDLFHAWRAGSNFKHLFRELRALHDFKGGYALKSTGMSKAIFELTDMDFSVGSYIRAMMIKKENINSLILFSYLFVLQRAGIDFNEACDDNILFLYDLYHNPQKWSLYGLDLRSNSLHAIVREGKKDYYLFAKAYKEVKNTLDAHPKMPLIQLILEQILEPTFEQEKTLIKQLNQIGYERIFYWSANKGLYFRQEICALLPQKKATLRLRDQSLEQLRFILSIIVLNKDKFAKKTYTNKLGGSHQKIKTPLNDFLLHYGRLAMKEARALVDEPHKTGNMLMALGGASLLISGVTGGLMHRGRLNPIPSALVAIGHTLIAAVALTLGIQQRFFTEDELDTDSKVHL